MKAITFRVRIAFLLAGVLAFAVPPARAQITPSEEERLQILTEPESIAKKAAKDKNQAPFEFFRSQVAPFDVLPFVKANHWCTVLFELRANLDDYDGAPQTNPVMLVGMPQQLSFRREAWLLKEKRANLAIQVMLPSANGQVQKEWAIEMLRPSSLRADASWQVNLTTLPPHQMLVLVLSKDATMKFAAWSRMSAIIPSSVERDGGDIEKHRYYRLVLPLEADKPALSSHSLTWSTLSHTIWDGYSPDTLTFSQQQALLDWLHWGGQLILSGGAGQTFSLLRESFLGPYLPADASGETVALSQDDLQPLSQSYPPPAAPTGAQDQPIPAPPTSRDAVRRYASHYQAPVPIRPAPKRPVYLSVLQPRPGSSTIPLGEASPQLLAVERRVGRGRITMLTLNPNEDALLAWPGLDTLIRRVVLRRPEEPLATAAGYENTLYRGPSGGRLLSPDLSWYRITSRDAGLEALLPSRPDPDSEAIRAGATIADAGGPDAVENELNRIPSVGDWRDGARIPRLARDLLEEASGITIPSSRFVLQVIIAYLLAVIPLNWLICRFLLNRREWTWGVVPLVALAFAIGVERLAARDMGNDAACDEIDLLEIHGDYPRAHLTRLASLYTTGRSRFAISYPNDPLALALPLDSGRSIRGEEVSSSIWQSYPVPSLVDFSVQPRSLSMFRAEQMLALGGPIRLEGDAGKRQVVNGSEFELRDAILIDLANPNERREHWLGTIAAGASIEIEGSPDEKPPARVETGPGPDANPILKELRTTREQGERDQGELRLVAWIAGTAAGQVIEPAVDRRRGFTAVTVHLRSGSLPSPDGPVYNRLAGGEHAAESRTPTQKRTLRPGSASKAPVPRIPAPRQPGTSKTNT